MSDYGDEAPPPDAEGLDRPSDNEDALDDTAREFGTSPPHQIPVDQNDDSDDESLLSEVDEAQFADFDPTAVQVAPDFETLKSIKVNKRKRAEGEEALPKKKKERTREKARNRRPQEDEVTFSGGDEVDGKRRRAKGDGEKRQRVRVEINEEHLTPEERRRRALDRAMDAAVKKSSGKRLRKGDIVSFASFCEYPELISPGSRANGRSRDRRPQEPHDRSCRSRR